ncbi:hypothetical protein GCM10025883_23670 [Mobilicoccus caccae]|uniref:HTH-type transcriptional repressor KstR2 C-terminal domain-containing protein n=2 Tax=Mobilicoccus caccae TaxID=1859295 RepID=A0ABQ6IT43_9MICO|nr:hypothetical protein GCM10025883_23670 [Mobilicoccus caccae]
MYAHHRSKEELLYAISLHGHQRVLSAIQEASAQGVTPTERLSRVAYAFGAWHAEGHVRARVVNYELGSLSPEHRAEVTALRRGIDTVFRSIVAAGIAAGEFDAPDASMTAVSLISLGIDISRWYNPQGSGRPTTWPPTTATPSCAWWAPSTESSRSRISDCRGWTGAIY